MIHRWMDYMEMRASHYSQTDNLIWSDLGYDAPSGQEEKKLNLWRIWVLNYLMAISAEPALQREIFMEVRVGVVSPRKNHQE